MEGSWKPFATVKPPKPPISQGGPDNDAKDEAEIAAAKAKQQAIADADKIGTLLNTNFYITEWTAPFLRNKFNQGMSVTRMYPMVAVAVDMFRHITAHESEIIELKRSLFVKNLAIINGKETRVRYGALDWSMPLADLLPQLGEIPKVEK